MNIAQVEFGLKNIETIEMWLCMLKVYHVHMENQYTCSFELMEADFLYQIL